MISFTPFTNKARTKVALKTKNYHSALR